MATFFPSALDIYEGFRFVLNPKVEVTNVNVQVIDFWIFTVGIGITVLFAIALAVIWQRKFKTFPDVRLTRLW